MLVCACIIALGVGLGVGLSQHEDKLIECPLYPTTQSSTQKTDGSTSGFNSYEGKYRFASVASDSPICSTVGTTIMARDGGSAVDAAIAAQLCDGLYNSASAGVGGGHFMTIYNRKSGNVTIVMAREMAPAAASEHMFANRSSQNGGYAIGVPGEIKGLWQAWRIGGRLPWKKLFQPAIKMAEEGIYVGQPLVDAIMSSRSHFKRFSGLRDLATNPDTGKYYKLGEKMKRPLLAKTLRILAEEGPDAFYNGSLTKNISLDIQDAGGVVTEDDLRQYTAVRKQPIQTSLFGGATVYSPPPPSSGVIYQYILNILSGFKFKPWSIHGTANATLTWHRIVEAFKFGFAKRTLLGDPDAETDEFKHNLSTLLVNLTSSDFVADTRSQITDDSTHGTAYYGPTFYIQPTSGTSHLSVLGPDGDAVSSTSTINLYFGSKVVGSRTGIIFNDEMDDFSTPGTVNAFGVPASPANFIKPRKRPLSSMVPSIVVGADGNVELVVGASGGTRIITGAALVTMETLWFKMGIKQSVDYPRIHHQLVPTLIGIEKGFPQEVIEGLRQKGHNVTMWPDPKSRVQGILQKTEGEIFASSDKRKYSNPDGY